MFRAYIFTLSEYGEQDAGKKNVKKCHIFDLKRFLARIMEYRKMT